MTRYVFKTHGVHKETRLVRSIQERFEAESESAARDHAERSIVPKIKADLNSLEAGELSAEDGAIIGVIDLRLLTWQIGDVPLDERPTYSGYNRKQLTSAFDLVKNPEHWKNPVDALVPKEADLDLIAAAIAFFTGSTAQFEPTPEGHRVTADGYFLTIGS